jgi:hypothetical protein
MFKSSFFLKLLFGGLLLGGGLATQASVPLALKKLPPSPHFSFDPGTPPEIPRCVDLARRFDRMRAIIEENNYVLTAFMDDSSRVMGEWYDQLQPLEGQPVTLEPGTFAALDEGGRQINEVVGLSYENADYIKNEMLKIAQALVKCLPQQGGSLGRSIDHGSL